MKAKPFISLTGINGDLTFHRTFNKKSSDNRGVYFWGFTLREDAGIPLNRDEFIIYYIGKSEKNIVERIMQEVTQLLFGGFGAIIDYRYLQMNKYNARIYHKQMSGIIDPDVLYTPDGLHVLEAFLTNKGKIRKSLNWMRKRLIFTWIEADKNINICELEREIHHIVRTNVLGIGKITKLTPKIDVTKPEKTKYFNTIDWSSNNILKEWLVEVNRNIP